MIEKLVSSKTRLKILKLFLSHIDDRYYLRELERMLDESLSPLRRQLVKLVNIGVLIVEEEANLKYYKLNKNFEGLEQLRKMVLEQEEVGAVLSTQPQQEIASLTSFARNDSYQTVSTSRQFRYDLVLLSVVSIFVLATAMFVVYANNKNIRQVAKMISAGPTSEVAVRRLPKSDTVNGEMASKKWKVFPGNVPVLSSGETGDEKNSKEL